MPGKSCCEIADAALSYFAVSPSTAKVFLLAKQALYADYLTDEMKRVVLQMNISERFVPVIQAGQEAGEIREGDPKALALCFFSALESAAENAVCFPSVAMPDAAWMVDLLKA